MSALTALYHHPLSLLCCAYAFFHERSVRLWKNQSYCLAWSHPHIRFPSFEKHSPSNVPRPAMTTEEVLQPVLNQRPRTFLDLPPEVRQQIYALAIPYARLSRHHIHDTEWYLAPATALEMPSLLFASRQIYRETARLFYSRATLEIGPGQREPTDARDVAEFYAQHMADYDFCPADLLKRVRSVHVYCGQTWVVDQDAFHAMFRWIVDRTGAEGIYLSRKMMQQARHVNNLISLNGCELGDGEPATPREIDVYARSVSARLLAGHKGKRDACGSTLVRLPHASFYKYVDVGGCVQLCSQPHWDTVMAQNDDSTTTDKNELLVRLSEQFERKEVADRSLQKVHEDGCLLLLHAIRIQAQA